MDIKHPYYHEFETNKAFWSQDCWMSIHPNLRGLKVPSAVMEKHPLVENIYTLLNLRIELWHRMNNSEQATWAAYWNLVFYKKRPLNEKFWNKFQRITNNIDQREARQQHIRQQINQMMNIQNKDHNNEAKGSDLAQKLTDKSNNRGAAMNLLPWE